MKTVSVSKKPIQRTLAISDLSISELELNPLNPRVHNEKQIKQLAKSIENFGFITPVLVDANRKVIAGHGRVAAMKLLGRRTIPVISVTHLSETQLRAFMIADNRLAECATWDNRLLGEHFKALAEVDLNFDLEAIGFEMGEIDLLIEGLEATTDDPDGGACISDSNTLVSRKGDLWELSKHRVLCGNALDREAYLSLMGTRKADVVFTDPPYNVRIDGHASGLGKRRHPDFAMASGEMSESEFTDFLSSVCNLMARYSREGSIHFICMDWRHMGELLRAGKETYDELKNLCVWTKVNAGMGSMYRSQHELVFVFKHGTNSHRNNVQLGQFGRYRTNVWHYPGANSFSRSTEEGNLLELHPTVKPIALVADAIMDCSARSDTVLDPFLGSGTTVIAAERTGRICYGIELDPAYIDVIVRRWQAFTGLSAKHASSGRTFNELEKEASDEHGR